MQNIKCKQCQEEFVITDDDLAFLEKISPEFGGKKFLIPPPLFCNRCREIKRFVWRNERSLYKRKSDKTGNEIISVYSPDKTQYKVWENQEWRSDSWNPMSYARDFDFAKPFFEQIDVLIKEVPRQAINTTMTENSDFCNQTWQTKDSYLCFNVGYAERCFYCMQTYFSKDCVDCFDIRNCEYCFGCYDCGTCNNCRNLDHCKDCNECQFIYDCAGCKNCFMSSGLHNKQYYFENKQLTKDEYEQEMAKIDIGKRSLIDGLKNRFDQMKKEAVHKSDHNIKCEDCVGDYLIECKNCKDCFEAFKSQDCVRVTNIDSDAKNCRDCDFTTEAEFCYGGTSLAGYRNQFCVWIAYGNDNYYCNFCERCSDCFGCVGLTHQQYCILNKQYTKEKYEELVPKIIEHMQKNNEWGVFFPPSISPFCYNETVAQIHYPSTKEEAVKIGAKWLDEDFSPKYEGDSYEPKDDIKDYLSDDSEREKLLAGVIRCIESGKGFKIMSQELAFYLKHNIPIPNKHSEVRYMEMFKLRNPRVLYDRQCMCEQPDHGHEGQCPNKFKTTYASERPERIYCEDCYHKATIS